MANVLVVDDHPDVADVLSQLLIAHGHTVECCTSGEEALIRLSASQPSVIVVDQRLPGMSGLEFTRAIKHRKSPHVIIWSANDSLESEARDAGAMEFWVKGSEQLFDHVDRLIQRLNGEGPSGS